MLLHHHGPNGSRDVEVDVSDSDATIADLAAALDPAAPSPHLTVDGRIVPPTVPLDRAPIGRGSTISTVTVADATTPTAAVDAGACSAVLSDRPVVAVSVIRGLDAGRSWLLPTGTFVLGRKARFPAAGRRDDPQHLWTSDRTVSGSQVELRVHGSTAVEVTDLGSENGTWLGDRRLPLGMWPQPRQSTLNRPRRYRLRLPRPEPHQASGDGGPRQALRRTDRETPSRSRR